MIRFDLISPNTPTELASPLAAFVPSAINRVGALTASSRVRDYGPTLSSDWAPRCHPGIGVRLLERRRQRGCPGPPHRGADGCPSTDLWHGQEV